jgi:RNA polymerase sigma factor (sigma-70 family)
MAVGAGDEIRRQLDTLFRRGSVTGLLDAQLIERFAADSDEGAFAALVERHGAMVFHACRSILGREADAEDAFQAVFLLLAQRARRLSVRGSLGPWLYAVAWRVARDMQKAIRRRQRHERNAAACRPDRVTCPPASDSELGMAVHEEIGKLPRHQRAVVVLCDLQGCTHVETARLLGCRAGTVKSRQARARVRLRDRLTRRGLAPDLGAATAFMAGKAARAAVPHALAARAVTAATQAATTRIAAGAGMGLGATRALARICGCRAPLWIKAATPLVAGLLAMFAVASGAGFLARRAPEAAPQREQPKAKTFPPVPISDLLPPLPAGATARIGPVQLAPGGPVSAVACQPGGTLVASAGSGIVKLWDLTSGLLVRELPGHALWEQTLSFSPDGSLLASGGDDWIIRVWDVKTGRPKLVIPAYRWGGSGPIMRPIMPFPIALTPDGKAVAGGCVNGQIILWDVETGQERAHLAPPDAPQAGPIDRFAQTIDTLAISPDAKWLAAASRSIGIQIWNLNERRLVQTIPNKSAWFQLAFSPDSRTLAWYGRSPQAGADAAGIKLWDVVAGRMRSNISVARQRSLAFSPDGGRLVSTGWDRKINLWDLTNNHLLKSMTGHTDEARSVVFSPDGAMIVSGGRDSAVRLWDVATGQERLGGPMMHWDRAMAVAVAPDGRTFVTGSRDRAIRVLNLGPPHSLRSAVTLPAGDRDLDAMAMAPDGARAAVAEGANVTVYDLAASQKLWSKAEFLPRPELANIDNTPTPGLVFSADGKRLVSLTLDSRLGNRQRASVRVWDAENGRLISQVTRDGYVDAAPLLIDRGQTLVLVVTRNPADGAGDADWEEFLEFYETVTGGLVREHRTEGSFASALAAAPDGSRLAVEHGSWVQVYDTATGALSFSLGGLRFASRIACLQFSPDGSQIAALESGHAGTVHVWRLADGKRLHELPAQATALAFTPDGQTIVTCGADGTALLWDLSLEASAPASRPRQHLTDQEIEARWTALALRQSPETGNEDRYARIDALAEGGDRTVEFLSARLLDPHLARKDDDEVERLIAPLADADARVRVRAANRLEAAGVWPVMTATDANKEPDRQATVHNARLVLNSRYRERRDDQVY